MSLTIDHLVYAAPHLEAAVDEAEAALGVRPSAGGHHIGLGTCNHLLSLGDDAYLEIVGPDRTQGDPEVPRPFAIDLLDAPRLVAWAGRVDDLDAAVAAARAAGIDPGAPVDMARALPGGGTLHWRLTFPTGAGPVHPVPFLIEWGTGTVHPSTSAAGRARLVSFAAEHPEPDILTATLAVLGADLPVTAGPEPRLVAELEGPAGRWTLR